MIKSCLSYICRRFYMLFLPLFFLPGFLAGQENADCLMCHEDPALAVVRQGKTISLFVNSKTLENSVHKGIECTSCHPDAAVKEFPHPEELAPVDCGFCHDE